MPAPTNVPTSVKIPDDRCRRRSSQRPAQIAASKMAANWIPRCEYRRASEGPNRRMKSLRRPPTSARCGRSAAPTRPRSEPAARFPEPAREGCTLSGSCGNSQVFSFTSRKERPCPRAARRHHPARRARGLPGPGTLWLVATIASRGDRYVGVEERSSGRLRMRRSSGLVAEIHACVRDRQSC
jgi:hypothetical protein